MSEAELKELLEKIQNDEKVDISLFTYEQKEFIKQFIDSVVKACKELADFILNNLVPIINKAIEKISLLFKQLDRDLVFQYYKQEIIRKQEIKPLYLDKRSKIHRCRNNC